MIEPVSGHPQEVEVELEVIRQIIDRTPPFADMFFKASMRARSENETSAQKA